MGTSGNDTISGTEGNDLLQGFGGDDVLFGLGGDDTLDGGVGVDIMSGGAGSDVYFVDSIDDIVREDRGQGRDIVYASVSYILRRGVDVELLVADGRAGTQALNLSGNEIANIIYGNNGANILLGDGGDDVLLGFGGDDNLNGGAGADIMNGGVGDDIYLVDNLDDIIQENAGEGRDIVFASVSYILREGAAAELLLAENRQSTAAIDLKGNSTDNIIYGSEGANFLAGGGGDDVLLGFGGNDTLDGGTGADILAGGIGDDIYLVDSVDDVVLEDAGEGRDFVYANVSYVLRAGVSAEALLTDNQAGTRAINLAGNEFDNIIQGNAGANILTGGGGSDILLGFEGDDVLDGGTGADLINGGSGNDIYLVDSIDDIVLENPGQGRDSVYSSVSYILREGVEVELLLAGDRNSFAALSLTGNSFANNIQGNAGANVLDGGGGADILVGLGGNDIYYVDDADDVVVEGEGEGTDSVYTSVSYALSAGQSVERLFALAQLPGAVGINLTGNEFANSLYGNNLSNVIDGLNGNDILIGGAGADVFCFATALGTGNIDIITDFEVGSDRILLGGFAGQSFFALASGALGSGAFRSGVAAADADDRIIYDSNSGALLYDADGVGGIAAVQFATLSPGLALTATHFTVSGAPNNLPVLTSGEAASVAENSPASTVVYTASATDADGDRIVFSLSGQHADRLNIDSTTGQVRLNSPADFETLNSYSFTVHAMDSSGLGSSRTVKLTVADVPDTPSGAPYVVIDTGSNDTAGTAQALDRARFAPVSDPNVSDGSLPSARIEGSVSPANDADFFTLTLKEGELLILDVDGTTSLDSLIRVFGPAGVEVAENDDQVSFDAGSTAHSGVTHNLDSLIRFRAPASGSYTFSIQSYSSDSGPTSSGSYVINVSIGPPATRAQIDEENILSLISGSSWSGGSVTYGFPTSASQYAPGEGEKEKVNAFETLNLTQRGAVRQIVGQVAGYTNLAISEVSFNPGAAQMRYAMSDEPNTAHAYYPGAGNGGDSWYNNNGALNTSTEDPNDRHFPRFDNPVVGGYGYMTFVHETGHALGLKHGHESPALSPDRDSMEFSVMTYRSYIGAQDSNFRNETWGFAQTFMMYDIAALQRMYGADFTYNADNSIYSWDPMTGAFLVNGATQWTPGGNRVFMTVWDGGGIDTYDLSNYSTDVTLDLRPGGWTTTSAVQLANLGNGNMARGNVANALLFNGDSRSLIENAIGGAGNDVLIANQAVNRLAGGAGADIFRFNAVTDTGRGDLADVITDFVSGSDRMDLSGIDANSNSADDDPFTFVGTAAFTGQAGQLRYEVSGSGIRLFADVNGDAVPDFELVVGSPTITAADFIL